MPAGHLIVEDLDRLLQQASAELQSRLQSGQPCAVESVLEAYPALTVEPGHAVTLIALEFQALQQRGDNPVVEDWLNRFPRWAPELSERLLELLTCSIRPEGADAPTLPLLKKDHDTVDDAPRPSLGHYQILEEIGRGGMGVVFRAHDTVLDREVALKMIRSGFLAEADEIERFHREARAAARIQHPHIVQVHELGDHNGQHFLAMALAPGGNLGEQCQGFREPSKAVALIEKIARAVGVAHQQGIVHRDLKPGNLLFDAEGEPLISDFGLAKFLDEDVELTRDGQPIGTPAYMAPEQTGDSCSAITPAADVWALGVILYELLTGRRPFLGSRASAIAYRIRNETPTTPRKLCPSVDRGLEAILLHCLEKDPALRYANGTQLADELSRWLKGEIRPPRWPARTMKWTRRHGRVCLAGGFLLAVVLVVALTFRFKLKQPLEDEDAQLLSGQSLTLIGEKGVPAHSRWVNEQGAVLASTKHERAFTIQSLTLSMLELRPRVPLSSYRLRARVRHVDDGRNGRVGIYCLYNRWDSAERAENFQCDLTLYDRPGGARDLRLRLHRYADAESSIRVKTTAGPLSDPLPPPPVGREKIDRWHDLSLVVTPKRIQAFLGNRRVQVVDRGSPSFSRFVASLFDANVVPAGVPPLFPTEGGLGLFVFRGTASFERVAIDPLAADDPAAD